MIKTVRDLISELELVDNKDLPIFGFINGTSDMCSFIDIDEGIHDRVDINIIINN